MHYEVMHYENVNCTYILHVVIQRTQKVGRCITAYILTVSCWIHKWFYYVTTRDIAINNPAYFDIFITANLEQMYSRFRIKCGT